MANPLRGVYLDGNYYGYVSKSYAEGFNLRNSIIETQEDRAGSIQEGKFTTYTLQLSLDNDYTEYTGDTEVGSTTWLGVSRLQELKNYTGANGVSMPIVFVTPYGVTANVVPVGILDIKAFNPDNPEDDSMEFRVTLTLEEVT